MADVPVFVPFLRSYELAYSLEGCGALVGSSFEPFAFSPALCWDLVLGVLAETLLALAVL